MNNRTKTIYKDNTGQMKHSAALRTRTSNAQKGLPAELLGYSLLDGRVRLHVDGCRRFIHHDQLDIIPYKRSSQGQQRSLSNTEIGTLGFNRRLQGKPTRRCLLWPHSFLVGVDGRPGSGWSGGDKVSSPQSIIQLGVFEAGERVEVRADGSREEKRILRDDRDLECKVLVGHMATVNS